MTPSDNSVAGVGEANATFVQEETDSSTFALIGGIGKQGPALAVRFARAGLPVLIGSRDPARAAQAAEAKNGRLGATIVHGYSNREAAVRAEVIILVVPYDGMALILEDIRDAEQGKIVINTSSPLDPTKNPRAKVPAAGSITAEIQTSFGHTTRVLAALSASRIRKCEAAS